MTTRTRIARLIDHTLLKPEATTAQVDALIAEAGVRVALRAVSSAFVVMTLTVPTANLCGLCPSCGEAMRHGGM